eukprot:m.17853 g.17853  ORF g.17853 m.17853 type:complete len:286 (-) comp11706_c0_seq1:103-960(-)
MASHRTLQFKDADHNSSLPVQAQYTIEHPPRIPHRAKCTCGAIHVHCHAEPIQRSECFCNRCRLTGAYLVAKARTLNLDRTPCIGGNLRSSAYPMDQAKFLRYQVVFIRGADHIRRFKLTSGDSAVRLYCKSCCSLIGTCSGTTPTISMPYDLFHYALTSNTKRHNVGNTGKEKSDMKEMCLEAKEADHISFRDGSYHSCKFYCCALLASLACGCCCCAQGKGGLSSMLSNKNTIKEIVFKNKTTLTADDQLPPVFVPQPKKQEKPGMSYKKTSLANDNFGFAEA